MPSNGSEEIGEAENEKVYLKLRTVSGIHKEEKNWILGISIEHTNTFREHTQKKVTFCPKSQWAFSSSTSGFVGRRQTVSKPDLTPSHLPPTPPKFAPSPLYRWGRSIKIKLLRTLIANSLAGSAEAAAATFKVETIEFAEF